MKFITLHLHRPTACEIVVVAAAHIVNFECFDESTTVYLSSGKSIVVQEFAADIIAALGGVVVRTESTAG